MLEQQQHKLDIIENVRNLFTTRYTHNTSNTERAFGQGNKSLYFLGSIDVLAHRLSVHA